MREELDKLYAEIAVCTKCHLAGERTNAVRDTGNPEKAAVVFVGEAPGANEIKHGIPFAGEAGKKLNTYLALAGLTREDVYITNVVRCRPTANGGRRNRTPTREIPACGQWLNLELGIIRPRTVVTLGNISLKWLCGKERTIGDCHGRLIETAGFRVYPMYHPAAAIYKRDLDSLIRQEFTDLGSYLGRVSPGEDRPLECEADFGGVKGTLPPSGDWWTVHRGIIQRPFEVEVVLPDGSITGKYTGLLDSRWVQSGEHWDLQLLNRGPAAIPFRVKWYIPAGERVCCYDYGRGE